MKKFVFYVRRSLIITLAISCSVYVFGCSHIGSIYPKENITQELERICRDEYKLDVKAALLGETLAAYMTLDYIYPEKLDYNMGSDLKNQLALLMYKYKKLDNKTEKSLNNFLIAVTRVALSTDAKIDFFEAVILDKLNGLEIVYIGYLTDTKRLKFEDISLAEGGKRIIYETRFNPKIFAEGLVKKLFSDMEQKSSNELINKYFLSTKRINMADENFFDFLRENDYKTDKVFRIDSVKSQRISKDRALIQCNVWQTFTPKETFENYPFKFPKFFRNEFLFVVDTINLAPAITQAIILFEKTSEGNFNRILLNEELAAYPAQSHDELFLDEIRFPDFLASQIAQRIIYEFTMRPYMSKDFYVVYSKGEFINDEMSVPGGAFKFTVDISEKKFLDLAGLFETTLKKTKPKSAQDPFTVALENFLERLSQSSKKHYYTKNDIGPLVFKIIADILYSYEFKNFEKVELFNLAYSQRDFVDAKNLKSFKRKVKLR
ncbi:MAG: hypothetical protein V1893_01890 [Candidatus Omnitrophota bacterium]